MIDETAARGAFGDQQSQILDRFRKFARSHIREFEAAKSRVSDLLGPKQNVISGLFREDLVRDFLRRVLPDSAGVDSGVIYGFEQVENSSQIDVLVWDKSRYPSVFCTGNYTIVSPESVIAAVSVKTRATRGEYESAVQNLLSVVLLDRTFREPLNLRPIAKLALFYDSPADARKPLEWIQKSAREYLENHTNLRAKLEDILKAVHPITPSEQDEWFVERIYPRMFVSLDNERPTSMSRGWGPPDRTYEQAMADKYHLEPYLYPQASQLTTPLEKFAYQILSETSANLRTPGGSLLSAWGDFHPQYHFRSGDADELLERDGVSLLPL